MKPVTNETEARQLIQETIKNPTSRTDELKEALRMIEAWVKTEEKEAESAKWPKKGKVQKKVEEYKQLFEEARKTVGVRVGACTRRNFVFLHEDDAKAYDASFLSPEQVSKDALTDASKASLINEENYKILQRYATSEEFSRLVSEHLDEAYASFKRYFIRNHTSQGNIINIARSITSNTNSIRGKYLIAQQEAESQEITRINQTNDNVAKNLPVLYSTYKATLETFAKDVDGLDVSGDTEKLKEGCNNIAAKESAVKVAADFMQSIISDISSGKFGNSPLLNDVREEISKTLATYEEKLKTYQAAQEAVKAYNLEEQKKASQAETERRQQETHDQFEQTLKDSLAAIEEYKGMVGTLASKVSEIEVAKEEEKGAKISEAQGLDIVDRKKADEIKQRVESAIEVIKVVQSQLEGYDIEANPKLAEIKQKVEEAIHNYTLSNEQLASTMERLKGQLAVLLNREAPINE